MLNGTNWQAIVSVMMYETTVKKVNPKDTSSRCPRCGMINTPNEDTYRCQRCGLEANRQLVGAVNIYMRALGLHPRALDKLPSRPTISLDESCVYGFGDNDNHK